MRSKLLSKATVQSYGLTAGHDHAATLSFRMRELTESHELMRDQVVALSKELIRLTQMFSNVLNYSKEITEVKNNIEKFARKLEL